MRTREGMAAAKAKGRLRGKQPKLKPRQEAHVAELYRAHPLGFADEAGGQFPECAADGAWVPPELVATGPIPAALDRT